jgi:peptidyl-prolyl cis-trans isomerase A (cyclophilin A)
VWKEASIDDDPSAGQSNKAYTVTFAKKGMPNSRSVQFFINFKDNTVPLDEMGFTPFGEVIEGKEVVDKINTEYGEGAPRGNGPDQMRAQVEGNSYFRREFGNLDYIKGISIL